MLDTPPLNNPEERRAKPKRSGTGRSSFGFLQSGPSEHLGAYAALRGRFCGQECVDLGPADSPADEQALTRPQPPAWQAQAGARAGLEGEAGGSGGLLCQEELSPRPEPGCDGVAAADGLFLSPANGLDSPPNGGQLFMSGNSPGYFWRSTPSPR
jgi:hypothetical protein